MASSRVIPGIMTHLLLWQGTKVPAQVEQALKSFQMLTSMFPKPVKVLIGWLSPFI